jgi:hypothetical protein
MATVIQLRAARGRLILDAGGLIAWAAGQPAARAVIRHAARQKMTIVVPTVVIAQVIRGGPRDAPINQALKQVHQLASVTPLLARQAGVLLGATSTTDVVDALVVAEALRSLPAVILTSDPGDIRRLAMSDKAHARVQVIPV